MSRKKTHEPGPPLTTEADAWDLGYREDALHLNWFGQHLPVEMVHLAVRHDRALTAAFADGADAHAKDVHNHRPPTPNPHKEVKS